MKQLQWWLAEFVENWFLYPILCIFWASSPLAAGPNKPKFYSASLPSSVGQAEEEMNDDAAEAEYFSKDFEWESLKQETENNPSYEYHLLPFNRQLQSQEEEEEESGDSKAWQMFHIRHSSGKFFKVFLSFLL